MLHIVHSKHAMISGVILNIIHLPTKTCCTVQSLTAVAEYRYQHKDLKQFICKPKHVA